MARMAEALEARAARKPLCVWLDEGPEGSAFAAFWAGAPPSGRVLLVVATGGALERPFEETIALPPFGEVEVAELVAAGADVTPRASTIRAIATAAQGNAALVGVLARRLIASLRARRGDELSIEPGTDLDGLLGKGFLALPGDARALVLAAALVDSGASDVAGLDEEAAARARAAARSAGWIALGPAGEVRLPSAAHRRAALAAASGSEGKRLAARALRRLGSEDPKRPDALVTAGLPDEAAAALRRAAEADADADPARAALLYERASALSPQVPQGLRERLTCVTGLALLGRYEDAARAVAAAGAEASDGPARAACVEKDAWLRARRGDLEGARRVLEEGLAGSAAAGAAVLDLRARLGRLMVTMGRFREALAIVEPLFRQGVALAAPARALSIEAAVLANAYVGEHARARTHLDLLERMHVLGQGRRTYLAALVAQLAGQEEQALADYRRAYEASSREGDVHTVAAVALNLGGLLAQQGIYGEALAAGDRAVRELGRIGAAAELAAALVNAANLFVAVGDLPAARRALARARTLVSKGQVALALAPAMFVEGDLACRAAEPQAAAPLYRAAAAAYLEGGQPHHAASALAAAALALGECGRADEGRRVLAEAQTLRAPEPDDAEVMRAAGVLALRDGGGAEAPAALAARIEAAARHARALGHRPRAWRLGVLAARLFERAGAPAPARTALDLARTTFQEIVMATPEHHRAGLAGDPDAVWLAGGDAPAAAEGPLAARALAAEGRLRRLLRINKRLNSELRLPRLLEMIVDTVIELTDAERGFLLLEDDSGALVVKVARNIDQRTLETAEFELSRSIAQRAAAGGEPIVTIDAAGDAALPRGDVGLRPAPALGAGGPARHQGARRGDDLRRPPPAQGGVR